MNAYQVVDRFLHGRWHVALEDVLCEACLSGQIPPALDDDVSVIRRCTHVQTHDDGGRSFTFEGTFMLMGVRYSFQCYIFADASGQRFVSDVAQFEAIDWQASLAI